MLSTLSSIKNKIYLMIVSTDLRGWILWRRNSGQLEMGHADSFACVANRVEGIFKGNHFDDQVMILAACQ